MNDSDENAPRCANPDPHERHMVPFQVEGRYSAFTCPGVHPPRKISFWDHPDASEIAQELHSQVFYLCEGRYCRYSMSPRRVELITVGKDIRLDGAFICAECGMTLSKITRLDLYEDSKFSDTCVECGSPVAWNHEVGAATCQNRPEHLWWKEA